MTVKNIFFAILMVIIVIVMVNLFTCPNQPKDIPENGYYDGYNDNQTYAEKQVPAEKKEEYPLFYKKPASLWPKITIGGTFTAVIVFVALALGVVSYFIGHNAGGRENKGPIFFAIGAATTVGVLGRAVTIFIEIKIYDLLVYIFSNNTVVAGTIADLIVYVVWIMFIAGIAVYLYETFTVTAKEIYQGG